MNPFAGFNLTPGTISGLIIAAVGGFFVFAIIKNARLMRVPDGAAPDAHYRRWKKTRPLTRLGKKRVFIIGFAAGLVITGGLLAFRKEMMLSLWESLPEFPQISREDLQYIYWPHLAGMGAGLLMLVTGIVGGWLSLQKLLTPEQKEARARRLAEQKADDVHFSAVRSEAQRLMKIIPEHMAIQNRMQYERREGSRTGKRKKIRLRFEWVGCTRTEIWMRFDGRPGKMPHGVGFYDIQDPNKHVLENIQYGIGRPCRWFQDSEFNLFLRVGLKNSLLGIPRRVKWADVYPTLPEERFAVPVGVNEYSKLVYEDFRKWPHVLIAGSTNQGKSTLLLQWITTLLKRNTPKQLRFIFVDLKDGLEMDRFRNLPHTLKFVDEPENTPDVMDWLQGEYDRRAKIFKSGGVQNIRRWNKENRARRLPYIVFIIDEMADLMLAGPALAKQTVKVATKLIRKGRMAGIHLWFATQIVEAKVLPLQIRGNFPARLMFAVPGYDESRLVLNNGLAAGLEPVGRCIYRHGSKYQMLQAPIATDDEIAAVIAAASEGEADDVAVSPGMEMVILALDYNDGNASSRSLETRYLEVTGESLSYATINRRLKTLHYKGPESVLDIDGRRVIVVPPPNDSTESRRVVVLNGYVPPDLAAAQNYVFEGVIGGVTEPEPTEDDCNTLPEAEGVLQSECYNETGPHPAPEEEISYA